MEEPKRLRLRPCASLEDVVIAAGAALPPYFHDLCDVLSLETALVPDESDGTVPDFTAMDPMWSALLHAPLMVDDRVHRALLPASAALAQWQGYAAAVRAAAAGSSTAPRELFCSTCDALALALLEEEAAILDGNILNSNDASEAARDAAGALMASAVFVRDRVIYAEFLPTSSYIGSGAGRTTAPKAALEDAGLQITDATYLNDKHNSEGPGSLDFCQEAMLEVELGPTGTSQTNRYAPAMMPPLLLGSWRTHWRRSGCSPSKKRSMSSLLRNTTCVRMLTITPQSSHTPIAS